MTRPVLICRPHPGADTTAKRVETLGMDAIVYPLFSVEPLTWAAPAPESFDAIMLTSANALRHGGDAVKQYASLPAFAVGDATAEAAEKAGFQDIRICGPNAQALITSIHNAGYTNVLHLSGHHVRPYDPKGLNIVRLPVYHAADAGDAAGLAAHLTHAPIVLVHSPRAGERLVALTTSEQRQSIPVIAISGTALEACGGDWKSAQAAEEPSDAAMLALAWQICHT